MEQIKVMLIDDDELLMDSMEIILEIKGNMKVVGVAQDGTDALRKLKPITADIALVDLNMKGMGGIELIPILKNTYPEMKVLVLTTFYDEHYISDAILNGADGYLLKDSQEDNIIHAIHQVLSGQSILDSKVLQVLSKLMSFNQRNVKLSEKDDSLPRDLTSRELEVCVMVAKGYTNSKIAEVLYISEGTVKNYMSSIYDKFDLHDRTQLAILLKNISISDQSRT